MIKGKEIVFKCGVFLADYIFKILKWLRFFEDIIPKEYQKWPSFLSTDWKIKISNRA